MPNCAWQKIDAQSSALAVSSAAVILTKRINALAVESMGGLSESAQQLIGEIHHSAGSHTWRDADTIGNHLVDAIAIAVQRCTGMALSECVHRERRAVLGSAE